MIFYHFQNFTDKKIIIVKFLLQNGFLMIKRWKLLYIIHGDRFLHHMVRYLVGTMIALSQNKISINDFKSLFNQPRKDAKIFKAPSNGLVLKEIFYEN